MLGFLRLPEKHMPKTKKVKDEVVETSVEEKSDTTVETKPARRSN